MPRKQTLIVEVFTPLGAKNPIKKKFTFEMHIRSHEELALTELYENHGNGTPDENIEIEVNMDPFQRIQNQYGFHPVLHTYTGSDGKPYICYPGTISDIEAGEHFTIDWLSITLFKIIEAEEVSSQEQLIQWLVQKKYIKEEHKNRDWFPVLAEYARNVLQLDIVTHRK